MNLYLIRHAQPDYENDTITEYGIEQAKLLAKWLKDIKVDELYHSSMGRAKKTASYLAEKWNVTPVSLDWAREIKWSNNDKGNFDDNCPWAIKQRLIDVEGYYPAGDSWKENPASRDETFLADYDLHCKAIDNFLAEHGYERNNQLYKAVKPNDKTVVIVCHGGAISNFVSYLTNVPFYQYISHMGVDLTAVTKLNFRGTEGASDAAQLIYLNSQAHLGVK